MLSTVVSTVAALVPIPFRPYPMPHSQNRRPSQPKNDELLAEVDGGTLLNRASTYLHLEQGLAKSFDKPAITSIDQPASHLNDLLKACGLDPKSSAVSADLATEDLDQSSYQALQGYLQLSYCQTSVLAQEIAAGMLENGVHHGSTIMMLIPNGAEFGLLLWTSIVMRLTIVCADPAVLKATGMEELRQLMRSLKPSVVVIAEEETAEAVDCAISELHLARPLRVCLTSLGPTLGWKSLVDLASDACESTVDRDHLVEDARNDNPRRVHSILFTSGTSGRPKGCPMTVGGQTHYLHSQAWLIDRDACPRALQQAHPSRGIAHLQTILTWRAGGTVVMTGKGFAADDVAAAIRHHNITFLVLTPAMVHTFGQDAATNSLDVSCVRTVQVGGDAVTRGILTRCAAVFPQAKVCVNHGMTEGGGSFTWPFTATPITRIPYFGNLCPVGTVSPGSIVRIWNAGQSRVCRRGELGTMHVCSGSLIHHYLFGESESSFYYDDWGHWYNTGDIAVMNAEGLVYILGRAKDMIKRGGAMIMPAPIENCIETYTHEPVSTVNLSQCVL